MLLLIKTFSKIKQLTKDATKQIKFTILFSFFSLVVVTNVVIIWHTQRQFVNEFSLILDEQIGTIVANIGRKTFNFLEPIQNITEASSWSLESPDQILLDRKRLAVHFMEVLRAFPQIERITVGVENGSAMIVSKLLSQTAYRFKPNQMSPFNAVYRATLIDKMAKNPKEYDIYYDKNGDFISRDENQDLFLGHTKAFTIKNLYDPREREWYQGAKSTHKLFWTDLYLYSSKIEIGVSISAPVYSKNGQFIGVVSSDLNINELANFLKIQSSGPIATMFLFNNSGNLVAYPDITKLFSITPKGLTLANLNTFTEFNLQDFYKDYKKKKNQKRIVFQSNPGGYPDTIHILRFPGNFKTDWKIGILVLGDKFLSHVERIKTQNAMFTIAILLLSLWLMLMISKKISRPIESVAKDLKRIQSLDFSQILYPTSNFSEISDMLNALKRFVAIVQSFAKFVPQTLVKQLLLAGRGAQLGGEQKTLTVMFCDIENFTTISEKIYAEQLLLHLSDYFEEMTQIIIDHNGTLDKYIGDAIMAFWGAPLPESQHAYRAAKGVLACANRLETLNKTWEKNGKPPMRTRFGISTGHMLVGNMGSSDRLQYTVLGDTVNLASRLEAMNKVYGTRILVNETMYESIQDLFIFRPVDRVAVKGKENGVQLYELLAEIAEAATYPAPPFMELALLTTQAYEAYTQGKWEKALTHYTNIQKIFNNDKLSKIFMERCQKFIEDPPETASNFVVRF